MRAVQITKTQKVREASQRKIIWKYRRWFGLFTQLRKKKQFSKEVFHSMKFFLGRNFSFESFAFRDLK